MTRVARSVGGVLLAGFLWLGGLVSLAGAQAPAAAPAAPQARAVAPAAQPAAEAVAAPDEDEPLEVETEEAEPLRSWQKQPPPPDGKWLTDEKGREYYVKKYPRPKEGGYLRISENRVRLSNGMTIDIVNEDDQFFFGKIYRVDNIKTKRDPRSIEPSAKDLAAKEAEYTVDVVESDTLLFDSFGVGLPTQGQWRNGFDLADMNRDGRIDVVTNSPRRELTASPHVFLNDGKGKFRHWDEARYPRLPYEYGDVAAADYDGDGDMDLAVAVHLRGLLLLLGDGKGTFQEAPAGGPVFESGALQPKKTQAIASRTIRAIDWRKDGRPEFVALAEGPMGSFGGARGDDSKLRESYGIAMYELGKDKVWKQLAGVTDKRLFGDSLTFGDYNGDGRWDFAAGANIHSFRKILHLQQEDGTWQAVEPPLLRERAYSRTVALADFNRDGKDDLAIGYQSTELKVRRSGVDVLLSQPDQRLRRALYVEPGMAGFYSATTGDIDSDGDLDLVAGTGDGRIAVFLGDGQGGFVSEASPEISGAAGCRVYDLGVADLDGDKKLELIAAFAGEQCPSGGSIQAWKAAAVAN